MQIANFTDLRKNLKSYLDSVINDSDTVIINRDGTTGVVIMSLDEYNSLKETEHIMASTETVRRIREGRESIAEGHGKRIKSTEELSDFVNSL